MLVESLTGLTRAQLGTLIERLQAPHSKCRGRPWARSLRQRVVIACASLRTNLTMRELAAVFAISKSQVHRILVDVTPRLAALLPVDSRGSSMALSFRPAITAWPVSPRTIAGPP